jgi:hypothetical protein
MGILSSVRRWFWPGLATVGAFAVPLHLLAMYDLGRRLSGWFMLTGPGSWLVLPTLGCLVVLLIDDRQRLSSQRMALVLALTVLLPPAWVYAFPLHGGLWATEMGMRSAISSTVGTAQLQSWALNLIGTEGAKMDADQVTLALGGHDPDRDPEYRRLVPKPIRGLHPARVSIVQQNDGQKSVMIRWGGGWLGFGWGLIVIPTDQRANLPEDYHRWRPGIYTYHSGS